MKNYFQNSIFNMQLGKEYIFGFGATKERALTYPRARVTVTCKFFFFEKL